MQSRPMEESYKLTIFEDGSIIDKFTMDPLYYAPDAHEHLFVWIKRRSGQKSKHFIKNLVWKYFNGSRVISGMIVDHIDEDKKNCHIDNLYIRRGSNGKSENKKTHYAWMNGDSDIYM